jgi:UDP-2,3-diacylglucosamine pyrophosphatase LpxH
MTDIYISDVHLGAANSNREDFIRFLDFIEGLKFGHVGILGDLVDFWRRSNARVMEENAEIIRRILNLNADHIHYVVGNHDLMIADIAQKNAWGGQPCTVTKSLRITDRQRTTLFTHGYDLDCFVTMEGLPLPAYEAFSSAMCRADDTLGGAASALWGLFENAGSRIGSMQQATRNPHTRKSPDATYRFTVSGAAHFLYGLQPKDRIVYGHTHRPFINKAGTVANTGSWCTEPGCSTHNTYVLIDDQGQMSLEQFNDEVRS